MNGCSNKPIEENRPLTAMLVGGAVLLLATSFSLSCSARSGSPASAAPTTITLATAGVAASPPAAYEDTTSNSTGSPGFASYHDRRNRFTIQYPAQWKDTNLRLLGDTDVCGAEVVGFADHDAATTDQGCYTRFVQVNILENRRYDRNTLAQLRNNLSITLERLRCTNDSVTVLQPWEETTISGVPALTIVLRTSDEERRCIALDCVLIGDGRFYEIECVTPADGWETYEPMFREILARFTVGVP